MRNPKRVLSKAQILDRVWSYDFGGRSNIVELYISYLRKKIDSGRKPMIHAARRRVCPQARVLSAPGSWSLRARLLIGQVLLLATVCVGIAAVTELALYQYLVSALDSQLHEVRTPRVRLVR